ncbi:MAG: carbohydrate ABC transporter substrate-binding protein, partial [Deltaproteobacteria bacterium]|nr:carbohydrate ABC transporter substrate-binding protein [Deltaproteobacteria bacterium]
MKKMNRRKFILTTASALGSVAAIHLFSTSALSAQSRIRHFWWGNPGRDKRTFGVIEIFNKRNPDIEVVGETVGFADYFAKLTTQIAGKNMPDVIQQGYGTFIEYVHRGALEALDKYTGTILDLSSMDKSALRAGTVNGKLYALSIGANAHMTMYNKRMYGSAGIVEGEDFDPYSWTYDDLKRIAKEVTKAAGQGVYGTDDNTANYQNFSDFVTQNGIARMFSDEGKFMVPQEIVEEYWATWKAIREGGGTPPGKVSAGLVDPPMSDWGIVTGLTATSYYWSNQLVGAQALIKDELGAAMFPNTPALRPGSYVQPSQFICLTRDSRNMEAAVRYMNAFINDPEMTDMLGLERGIPGNKVVREALRPGLSPIEAQSVEYFDNIQDKIAPLPPPFPPGATEIEKTYMRISTGVLLDRYSIKKAAKMFVKQAEFILKRAAR